MIICKRIVRVHVKDKFCINDNSSCKNETYTSIIESQSGKRYGVLVLLVLGKLIHFDSIQIEYNRVRSSKFKR